MSSKSTQAFEWMPKKQKPSFEKWLLLAFALGTGGMTFMAMPALISDEGWFGTVKAALIAATAGLVSYAVNRFAIEKGAYLAATGFGLAGLVSVASMLFVGGGLFASTYAGLTIASVDELQLHDYGRDLNRFIAARGKAAAQAMRAVPVMSLISNDLKAKAACEVQSSCVSNRPNGGYGPVAKALEGVAARADEIARQMADGDAARNTAITRLNTLIETYQKTLGETGKPLAERRQALIRIDAEIDQALSALDEAVPVALLSAYAKELSTGIAIDGRGESAARVNAIMAVHGQNLATVLSTLDDATMTRPAFPASAGVSATFAYITHFLPIAALTACVELILPLTLWVFTMLAIVWEKYQRDPVLPGPGRVTLTPVKSRAVPLSRKRIQSEAPLLALEKGAGSGQRTQRVRQKIKSSRTGS